MTSILNAIFGAKKPSEQNILHVDMHSHLLAAIDDGVGSLEESFEIIRKFRELGYKKIITTPHIMSDFYRNTPEIIQKKLKDLQDFLDSKAFYFPVEAAAEYYVDEAFLEMLRNKQPILSFGKEKYILFETGFMNPPPFIEEAIFLMQTEGYKPIFAHPERYIYLYDNFSMLERMIEMGICLQINLLSLTGYYSREAKKMAEKLIDANLVDFAASDCHSLKHFEALKESTKTSYYKKLIQKDLLNNTLM
ncbi:MAG: capsular biosynthesis protein [Raineya sp.]|jgi:tyrosine-protein phosphatase YwqE|nr:capsular biosynthesis protein [Raineya sp.]